MKVGGIVLDYQLFAIIIRWQKVEHADYQNVP
jgi:hypothetical protein